MNSTYSVNDYVKTHAKEKNICIKFETINHNSFYSIQFYRVLFEGASVPEFLAFSNGNR